MKLFISTILFSLALVASATTWKVNNSGSIETVKNSLADGDTLFIEAGLFTNQAQVIFKRDNLLIRGIDGRPRLQAGSKLASNANGKAIFVIQGKNCIVENIEFANASVPDNNGAGIRQEGCNLAVRYCLFTGNEMGILGGNNSPCTVLLEHNVFIGNGNPSNPGFQHNVYINHIDTLIFRYNYSVDAIGAGHELKSRAHVNIITYNYLTNINSTDSRTIDLPNGGTTILLGNIIEQGQTSENSNIVGYGLEGLTNNAPHNLWVVNNTFVNKKNKGSFIQVRDNSDTLFVKNNILVGPKTGGLILGKPNYLDSSNNIVSDKIASAHFVDATQFDYHLKKESPALHAGLAIQKRIGNYALVPSMEYIDTSKSNARPINGSIDCGAFELPMPAATILQQLQHISIYPNPLKGNVLYCGERATMPFELYTTTGNLIQLGEFINGKAHLNDLPAGIYLIGVGGGWVKLVVE